jgi:chemotaxis protein methyltransferase CheR
MSMLQRPFVKTPSAAADSLAVAGALMDASHQPLLLFDSDLRLVTASRAFRTAYGWLQAEDGRALEEFGGGWDTPQVRSLLEGAFSNGRQAVADETNLVREGEPPRRLVLKAQEVAYGAAPGRWVLLALEDVTQARAAEAQLAVLALEKDELLVERGMLMREMQHRIANSLQIIASVLQIKARGAGSDESRSQLRDAHQRVMSVAAVQRHLELGAGEVEVGPYLEKLCQSLESAMADERRTTRLTVRCDPAIVTSHEVTSLGLIVAELVMNAFKYAFPDGREGRVDVAYEAASQGWSLSVTDNGAGRVPPMEGQRVGLGTGVVNALARQLGARVELSSAEPGSRTAIVEVRAAVDAGVAEAVV